MTTFGKVIKKPIQFKKEKDINGLISASHNVGIEVEVENCIYNFQSEEPQEPDYDYFACDFDPDDLPDIRDHWSIVQDHSLRKGCEFIFNSPKKGSNIIKALDSLDLFFKEYRVEGDSVKISDRCSVHCHLDVRDLTEEQLVRVLLVYVLFERVLFKCVQPSRLKNNYCRPITDSTFNQVIYDIKRYSDNKRIEEVVDVIRYSCSKYSALNLLPITTLGTIEFRHHQGTSAVKEDILAWINIILSLKLAAYIPTEDILTLWKKEGYKGVLLYLFKGTNLESKVALPEIKDLMNKGYIDFIELLNFSKITEDTYNRTVQGNHSMLEKKFKERYNIDPLFKPKGDPIKQEYDAVTASPVIQDFDNIFS